MPSTSLTVTMSPLNEDEIRNLCCQLVFCQHTTATSCETKLCNAVKKFFDQTMMNERLCDLLSNSPFIVRQLTKIAQETTGHGGEISFKNFDGKNSHQVITSILLMVLESNMSFQTNNEEKKFQHIQDDN